MWRRIKLYVPGHVHAGYGGSNRTHDGIIAVNSGIKGFAVLKAAAKTPLGSDFHPLILGEKSLEGFQKYRQRADLIPRRKVTLADPVAGIAHRTIPQLGHHMA